MKGRMKMPKYGYWLVERTEVYKEIEADSREDADEIAEEFMYSEHIDWGRGSMNYYKEYDGQIEPKENEND
jgi:hypothetical protein